MDELNFNEMQERAAAGAQIMGTTIEGDNALARAQRRMELREAGFTVEQELLSYFRELSSLVPFAVDAEQVGVDLFRNLSRPEYNNPYAFWLVCWILSSMDELTPQWVERALELARKTGKDDIIDADLIRYFRLLRNKILE